MIFIGYTLDHGLRVPNMVPIEHVVNIGIISLVLIAAIYGSLRYAFRNFPENNEEE